MIDNYNNLNIHTVSGTLIKSHPKSRFRRFHIRSQYAGDIFSGRKDIVPLQFMLCGDGELLMEYVYESDWNEGEKDD